jgi:LDH2 family malate/lactate/ureidoglycolate dehydrogenase
MSGGNPIYPAQALVEFAAELFRAAGLDDEKATTVAEVLLEGDLLGHTTHGLALAAPYLRALEDSGMTRDGEPAVVSDHGGALCWDGRRLPGPWLVVKAIDLALARAAEHGIAAVAIRQSHHIACLAAYLERATARGGMILLTCSDPSEGSVAPFGGLRALFTPDPIAIGIPTDGAPILIDMSASITTNGMTARLRSEGRRFPGRWGMTATAAPTRRPTGALRFTSRSWRHTRSAAPRALSGRPASSPRPAAATRRRPASMPCACPARRALLLKRRALADGVGLYPGIMSALQPWAERLGVALPRARG